MSEVKKIPDELVDVRTFTGGEIAFDDDKFHLIYDIKVKNSDLEYRMKLLEHIETVIDTFLCEYVMTDIDVDDDRIKFSFLERNE